MTYAELILKVASWTHRRDLAAEMVTFAELTESKINELVRAKEMSATLAINLVDQFYLLPDDYLDIQTLSIPLNTGRKVLDNITLDQLAIRGNHSLSAYSQEGSQLRLNTPIDVTAPVPADLVYYADVLPISPTNNSTDMLTAYPMLYFTGMMYQAQLFIQDSEQSSIWNNAFNEQIVLVNKQNKSGKWKLPRTRK